MASFLNFGFFFVCGLIICNLQNTNGHGRLIDPPARASIWKVAEFVHLNPPTNYNDNELFCGGLSVQIANGDKCGECGDAYHLPRPRDNEAGGFYGRGIITANYSVGQEIVVGVDLTANHLGYFEFRICPNNQPTVPVEQECLDRHVLQLADGSGVQVPIRDTDYGLIETRLRLPEGLTCTQCVLQWHYKSANSYGECEDGSGAIGCGPQETFRGCADVAIY